MHVDLFEPSDLQPKMASAMLSAGYEQEKGSSICKVLTSAYAAILTGIAALGINYLYPIQQQ